MGHTVGRGKPEALVVCGEETVRLQFHPAVLDKIASVVSLREPAWVSELDSAAARSRLATVEILLTSWGAPRLTAERLAAAPWLRAVFHCAGSVRGVVSDEIWRRGILVTSAAAVDAIPVAEYTLAAIIFAGKRIPYLAARPRRFDQGWGRVERLGDLSNFRRTVGVVGFSRVGRRVVDLLRVLDGTRCLVADPYADPAQVAAAGATPLPLPDLLPLAEILSLHAPEIPQTRHMIGEAELRALPDHATLINTARGSLVDTAALERECATGRIHAILDVTDPEPLPPDSPLFDLPNVMLTPHVAGSTGSEIGRLVDHALAEVSRYLADEPPQGLISQESLAISA